MFDHVSFRVANLAKSHAFYATSLAPLGIVMIVDTPQSVAFGKAGRAQFWLNANPTLTTRTHLAFAAENRAAVRAFHAAALSAGGTDNGAPGPRPHYHPNYYGAFVLDPDGNNVEAVCRNPEV